MSTPSSSAVLESSAMVRNPRPMRVRESKSDKPQIRTIEHASPNKLRNADHQAADPPVGAAEQRRHALQLRAPIADGEILEQDQERHRADQRHELLRVAHPAPGEAFDHKRSGGADRECAQTGERPRHAMANEHPGRHAADHEQAGDAEVEKLQHANGERQGDADHGVDRAEHQPIDDLLGENGPPLDLPPAPSSKSLGLEYDFPGHRFMRHFAVERRKSMKIVARLPPRLASAAQCRDRPTLSNCICASSMVSPRRTGNGSVHAAGRCRTSERMLGNCRRIVGMPRLVIGLKVPPDSETRRDTARNTTPYRSAPPHSNAPDGFKSSRSR